MPVKIMAGPLARNDYIYTDANISKEIRRQ